MALGIKNSWKYEKDLILILNQDNLKKLSVGWGVFEHLLSNMKILIAI